MTEKFDNFIKFLLESNIIDMPDTCPYGFWINSSGDILPVNYESHAKVARKIIDSNKTHKEEFDKNISGFTDRTAVDLLAINYVLAHKWMKCVVTKYDNPTLYYKCKDVPTPKQKQALNDIEMRYDIYVSHDRG